MTIHSEPSTDVTTAIQSFSRQHIIHFLHHTYSDVMPLLSAQPRGLGTAALKDHAANFGGAETRPPKTQLCSRPAKQQAPTAPRCARSSVRSSAPSPQLRSQPSGAPAAAWRPIGIYALSTRCLLRFVAAPTSSGTRPSRSRFVTQFPSCLISCLLFTPSDATLLNDNVELQNERQPGPAYLSWIFFRTIRK